MRVLNINRHTYFFSIIRIAKTADGKLTYYIRLDSSDYILSKSIGKKDCEQLDKNPPLDTAMGTEICLVLTEFEDAYKRRPSLEELNHEIFKILTKRRSQKSEK
jgi:hypothetical protein